MEGPNRSSVDHLDLHADAAAVPTRAGRRPRRATTHWTLTGRPDGGSDEWTVRVADGVCTVVPGHDGDATLGLTMGPVEFIKLITKTGNPVMMLMTGKIKIKGDMSLAANVGSLFEVPRGLSDARASVPVLTRCGSPASCSS